MMHTMSHDITRIYQWRHFLKTGALSLSLVGFMIVGIFCDYAPVHHIEVT